MSYRVCYYDDALSFGRAAGLRLIFAFFLLLLIFFVSAFAMLNAEPVSIQFLLGTTELPLIVGLLMALCVGIVIAFLVMIGPLIRLMFRCQVLQSRVQRAEDALLLTQGAPKDIK